MKVQPVTGLIAVLICITVSSCKKNHYRVDISYVKTNIEVKRLETDLFTLDPGMITEKVPELRAKYGDFLQLFSYVINTGDVNDPAFGDFLARFCTDRLNNEVYDSVMKVYPGVDRIQNGLVRAFRHYLYYFPERKVPGVFTCITGFNNSIITGDSVLGISLDRYLGAHSEYYPRLNIYNYMALRMTPDYIVPDCMYGWAASEWDFSSAGYPADNVITEMIHEGKLRYFEKCMLPGLPDTLIFGFTGSQMKFCLNNEDQMWEYLLENNLLFKTDQFTIRKLIGEAPFTTFFTKESPGRAAAWIGFRIVEACMMKNPEMNLAGIMKNSDIQSILEMAKYNPR